MFKYCVTYLLTYLSKEGCSKMLNYRFVIRSKFRAKNTHVRRLQNERLHSNNSDKMWIIKISVIITVRKLLTLAPKRSSQTAKKDDVGRGTQINPTQQIERSHPPLFGRYPSGRQHQPYTVSDENRAGLDDKYKSSRSFQNEDSDYSVYRGKEPPFDPGYNGVQCDDGSYTGSPRRCQYKGIGFLGNRGKQDTFK